jgi:hypothetical protein
MAKQGLVYIVLVPRVGLIALMAKQGHVYTVLVPRVGLIALMAKQGHVYIVLIPRACISIIEPPSKTRVRIMLVNVTFNNISVISLQSVLLVEETGVPRETHRPAASH